MFERRGIKNFVVAAASFPSPFGELRDCLEAETIVERSVRGGDFCQAQFKSVSLAELSCC